MNDFYWGVDRMSMDFQNTLQPGPSRLWHQCCNCGMDLRGGRHKIDCTLSINDRNKESSRVSFIIAQFYRVKGVSSRSGGRSG